MSHCPLSDLCALDLHLLDFPTVLDLHYLIFGLSRPDICGRAGEILNLSSGRIVTVISGGRALLVYVKLHFVSVASLFLRLLPLP